MPDQKRDREQDYFDATDFSGLLTDEQDTREVRVPETGLTHVLSVRLGPDDLRALTHLAKAQGVGATTMARILLRKALHEPGQQVQVRAPGPTKQTRSVAEPAAPYAEAPPADAAPAVLVIPQDRIEDLGRMLSASVASLVRDAVSALAEAPPPAPGS